jgi:diacylglycerol kinase (ATP)
MARTCIIVNPRAGCKAGMTVNTTGPDEIKAAIAAAALDADLVLTTCAGHATELAREAVAAGCERVVAAGGDGTVREVIAGLVGAEATLGILPLGSAMNIVRSLGIPLDIPSALRLIVEAERVERLDVGKVRDGIFVEAGGVGLAAGVFHLLGDIDAGRWQRLRTLVAYLRRARGTRMIIDADGRRMEYRTLSLVLANAPLTGLRLPVAPGALMNDGLFNGRIFLARTKLHLAGTWLRIVLGRGDRLPDVVDFTARTVRVETRRPVPVHADDDLMGRTPTTFDLLPGAVRMIVGAEAPALTAAPAPAGVATADIR